MKKLPKILVVVGPTASGKTALGIELARQYNGEIISADSRQVYTGMDIGTGKDLLKYTQGGKAVKYHLIDVISPTRQFDLKTYQTKAYKAISGVIKRGKLPIIVGGSGLYVQALVDGYTLQADKPATSKRSTLEKLTLVDVQALLKKLDSHFFNKLPIADQKNKRRLIRYIELLQANERSQAQLYQVSQPRYQALVLGLDYTLPQLRKRIKERLDQRFKEGMVEEVRTLHKQGLSWSRLESFGLEYKYIALYIQKKITKEEMRTKLEIASGQFAKRQLTWLRRWEKQGREILWFKPQNIFNRSFSNTINRFLTEKSDMRSKNNIISL